MTGHARDEHVSARPGTWPDDRDIGAALEALGKRREPTWQSRDTSQPDAQERDRRSALDWINDRPAQSQRNIRRTRQHHQAVSDRVMTWLCRFGWLDVAFTAGLIGVGVILHLAR